MSDLFPEQSANDREDSANVREGSSNAAEIGKAVAAIVAGTLRKPEREVFDWNASTNDDVIINRQPQTAVYENPYGQVVIRQESADGIDDEDPFIFICRHHLPALVARLQTYLPEKRK